MSEETFALDFRQLLSECSALLPERGLLPGVDAPGSVRKVPREEAAAWLHRDSSLGLSPFDPAPWWRVVASPADSVRLGFGRAGVGRLLSSAPLLLLDVNSGAEPPRPTAEPWGLVRVGPVDAKILVAQAAQAYSLTLGTAKKRKGSMLGLPGAAP